MSHKTCRQCGTPKPLTEFHKNVTCSDGRACDCKECRCAIQRRYSKTSSGREVQRKADQIRNKRFPERRSARTKLFYAIAEGRVQRQPCWVCGEEAEAHHPDYAAPLDVVWLCLKHHQETHRLARAA